MLDLSHNGIEAQGARVVARNLVNLAYLNLSANYLNSDEAVGEIASGLNSELVYLNLEETGLKDAAFERLCEVSLPKLRELSLSRNLISEKAFTNNNNNNKSFSLNLQNINASTVLDLSFNKIGSAGARAIAHSLINLTSLNLNSNEIGDAGLHEVCIGLGKYNQMQTLSLNENKISSEGAVEIAKSFRSLKQLALLGNKVDQDSVGVMLMLMKNLSAFYFEAVKLNDSLKLKFKYVLKN